MPEINLPITRYYGSKRKLVDRIWNEIERLGLEFDSVLDVFGGTGIFSYYSKIKGKRVIYNDIFLFNSLIGKKLIENVTNNLTYNEAVELLLPQPGIIYDNVIQRNFSGIYFTDSENQQIDIFIQNTNRLIDPNKKLSAYYILFQSCIIKRPYNLFHRNNLNMRTGYTGGGFGNKTTWERSFEDLFLRFIEELDEFTFDNGRNNLVTNDSALNCTEVADLVYIDPPYFSLNGSHTTYHSKYHFLEGLAHYEDIEAHINSQKKNKQIEINNSDEFEKGATFLPQLEKLILMHQHSHIVISYRNNGKPSIKDIEYLMVKCKPNYEVYTINLGMYGYALSKSNLTNSEFLVIGTNHLKE
ncbi:DNA adenine methylase [Pedobacter sandarakinus]|uniref:DNA adenine methylase n=1 Tax=Pedobacter sandarakinus TaxID=353156 RepID=UPI002246BB95|nr:DNA adenine methylase [Pedobacter sandarakinus]MCX2573335.1 DNA adenine methylase [Pedobacter sandarakinus]